MLEKLSDRFMVYRVGWAKKRAEELYPNRNTLWESYMGPPWVAFMLSFLPVLKRIRRGWRETLMTWRFHQNISAFYPIAHLVKLEWGWDQVSFKNDEEGNGYPTLNLEYAGAAETEANAQADLGNIMIALKVFFGHLRPEFSGNVHARRKSQLNGLYEGVGYLGKIQVLVTLVVPWFPEDCKVNTVTKSYTVQEVECPMPELAHG